MKGAMQKETSDKRKEKNQKIKFYKTNRKKTYIQKKICQQRNSFPCSIKLEGYDGKKGVPVENRCCGNVLH